MFQRIDDWVEYIQTLHHKEIELGLDRVTSVYQRLYPEGLQYRVISIAGTNGKGSTAELLNSIYCSAGYQVGKFTSPHLVSFNERYEINGVPVKDQYLLAAFSQVELARQEVPLTFFEYGTLVAIVLFQQMNVDLAIMEVGLGGRLDAVNILNPDLSIVTNVSIDHTDWLGNTIELIAREKIAIARKGKPCLLGMSSVPHTIVEFCKQNNVDLYCYEKEFNSQLDNEKWIWSDAKHHLTDLPLPFGQADCQLINASLAIKAVTLLASQLPVPHKTVSVGLAKAEIRGRCQVLQTEPYIVIDVSHNEASVARLSQFIRSLPIKGKVLALCGMLEDKEITASFKKLSSVVDEWHLLTIDHERGATAGYLSNCLNDLNVEPTKITMPEAKSDSNEIYLKLKKRLNSADCMIVFGSFFVVSDIMQNIIE